MDASLQTPRWTDGPATTGGAPTIDSPDPLALARFYARLLDERTKTLLPDGHPFCLYAGE